MKKVLLTLLIGVFGFAGIAQDNEFAKMMREMYQSEFIDIMNENMNLNESQDALFQPIFTEFLGELSSVMDRKLADQGKFAKYFDGMSDEQATELMKSIFANSKSYDKLLSKYAKKMTKTIGPQSAFRFLLIVEKVISTIDYPMIQNVPLVNN